MRKKEKKEQNDIRPLGKITLEQSSSKIRKIFQKINKSEFLRHLVMKKQLIITNLTTDLNSSPLNVFFNHFSWQIDGGKLQKSEVNIDLLNQFPGPQGHLTNNKIDLIK